MVAKGTIESVMVNATQTVTSTMTPVGNIAPMAAGTRSTSAMTCSSPKPSQVTITTISRGLPRMRYQTTAPQGEKPQISHLLLVMSVPTFGGY